MVDLELVSEEDSVDMVAREVKVDMEDKVDSEEVWVVASAADSAVDLAVVLVVAVATST